MKKGISVERPRPVPDTLIHADLPLRYSHCAPEAGSGQIVSPDVGANKLASLGLLEFPVQPIPAISRSRKHSTSSPSSHLCLPSV
ncbi:hypothetical protein J6590_055733 [Homalodisca vitripennis]|nr:hypothetical protein J6590_055733 [Homalodisca vitripennis]